MKRTLFPTFALVILTLLPMQLQANEENKQIRATVQKWIAIMKETQTKQREWREKKQILQDSKAALISEREQMKDEILAAHKRINSSDESSKEKIEAKDNYDTGRKALLHGLNDLDAKVSAVIPLLPEELINSNSSLAKQITDHQNFVKRKDKEKISRNGRLQAMITILIEAEKFNQVITPFDNRLITHGEDELAVDGIYFGLAMGYAANEAGTIALQLTPSPEGWTETKISDPELAGQIRELINAGNGSGETELITLPIEIAK